MSRERPTASPGPSQLRQRTPGRASTMADMSAPLSRRRSSMFSDSFSEARRSIRSSTEDLLSPKANPPAIPGITTSFHDDTSHIHSAPLFLALLPAVGGLLFTNGSAVVTDITILLIGAVLLNWCVKIPWDWYRSAQATRAETDGDEDEHYFESITEENSEDENQEDTQPSSQEKSPPPARSQSKAKSPSPRHSSAYEAASAELRTHELIALTCCFVGPVIGALSLHAIRNQLSRPSEGLVSDYNLIIFLLASELRPFIHLIKMIKGRTLHLQRIVDVNVNPVMEETRTDSNKMEDLLKRLEELEAHVAQQADSAPSQASLETTTTKAAAQVATDVRKGVQPELDALNRAVRRYEKRTTVASIQTDARLHELESRVKDAISLAASAQRNAHTRPQNYAMTLTNWLCATVVVPVELLYYVSSLPARTATWGLTTTKTVLGLNSRRPTKNGQPRMAVKAQSRGNKKII